MKAKELLEFVVQNGLDDAELYFLDESDCMTDAKRVDHVIGAVTPDGKSVVLSDHMLRFGDQ